MEIFFYENEFRKRIKELKEIRKKSHPNERVLIDETIRTMINIIDYYKNNNDPKLVDAIESDYLFLKSNSFLWENVRKFALIDAPNIYGEFIFENSLDISDDEVIGLTHDFYKNATDKKTFDTFLKIYNKRNKNLGIFQDPTTEFVADTVFLPYYQDSFIQLNRKNTYDDVGALIHEYGHSIQHLTNFNPTLYDTVFAEVISVFFEIISFDYYANVKGLQYSTAMAQWDDFNSRILFADDLTDEFDIIKQIKRRKKGRSVREKIAQYAKQDASSLQGFVEYNTSENLKYVIAELFGIELYMIYRKDRDKAMYIIHKIMELNLNLSSEDYYKEIEKLGIHLNRKVGEYQDHLYKRMRYLKRKIDTP